MAITLSSLLPSASQLHKFSRELGAVSYRFIFIFITAQIYSQKYSCLYGKPPFVRMEPYGYRY